ncbi:hypothetical protein F4779DRAFT_560214 [Xylariaceae sp. FL0662B]|nr:hypothetical protein F4779DRAFT_560214 [Xylariaceae sp. FL0662B]
MATAHGTSVTIDREYFDTLLRRVNANCTNGYEPAFFPGRQDSVVSISREEYEGLLLVKRQYESLKQNLMGAGVGEEVIATLSQDDARSSTISPYKQEEVDDGGARLNTPSHTEYRSAAHLPNESYIGNEGYHNGGFGAKQLGKHHDWADPDPDPIGVDYSPSYSADGPTPDVNNERARRTQYARMCKRTISISGLPDNTTHWDMTSVIHGGQLLDVYLRPFDHIALVSFLREEDAVRFYEYARRNDLYVRNKRVFIRWADRHFHLAGHVASKIAIGATRNMIIRRCDPKHTEDAIREDLEHIHNLVVIKIEFLGGSCYIKTNSVHNAMFARTCMMSRAKYKGSRIEWDIDECDRPIETVSRVHPKPQRIASTKKPTVSMQNRFASLRLDDDDNDETDDKFDTSSELPSTVNVTA